MFQCAKAGRAKAGRVPWEPKPRAGGDRGHRKTKGPVNYARAVCMILKKMDATHRRAVIGTKMKIYQKQALEAFMKTCKQCEADHPGRVAYALCDIAERAKCQQMPGRGIMKCAAMGKVYGYYAKAGLQNLTCITRIQRDLGDALRDHIILARVLERVRDDGTANPFPAKVQAGITQVLDEEGIDKDNFLRMYTVNVCAHHWIGRNLYVPRARLGEALEVWQRFDNAKTFQLFRGGMPTAVYTPERAEAQWKRIREAFLELRPDRGKLPRWKAEAHLAELEAHHRPAVAKAKARWKHGRNVNEVLANSDVQARLLRRMERMLHKWECAVGADARRKEITERRQHKQQWQQRRKRRWDGKEALAEFERRIRGCRPHHGATTCTNA